MPNTQQKTYQLLSIKPCKFLESVYIDDINKISMKKYLFFVLWFLPILVSAKWIEIKDNQVIYNYWKSVQYLTLDGVWKTDEIQSCSNSSWASHFSVVKQLKESILIRNTITCLDKKNIKLFSEYDSGPYIGYMDDREERFNHMPIIIPNGSNAFDKYYLIYIRDGKPVEWHHGYLVDITAKIFDASNVWKYLLKDYSYQDLQRNDEIIREFNNSLVNLDIFGKKYLRFRWNIAFLDTDKNKNEFLQTKRDHAISAWFNLERYSTKLQWMDGKYYPTQMWRGYNTTHLTWNDLEKFWKTIFSPKSMSDFQNHVIDGVWYETFISNWVAYSALPTYDSIVSLMKPTDFYSHQDATYMILYDSKISNKTTLQNLQNIIDTQSKIPPYPNTPSSLTQTACIAEKYIAWKDDNYPEKLTKKAGYKFYHIKRSDEIEKLTWNWEIVTCGHVLFGPSEPNQYFIYSEKSKKFLYVNLTQDPYPFDPTSIDF